MMKQLAINNPFNAPVFHEETVSSTMDIAHTLAEKSDGESCVHGTVIAADFQEAGRGRVPDRPWNMERKASLPFTVLLRYSRIEDIPQALTLRTGLAVALAIEDFAPALGGLALIKWPNDIMIHINGSAKKTAGILTEASAGFVFIGIGINIAQKEFPDLLRNKATSLSRALGENIDIETRFILLEKILARLYHELETGGEQADWRSRIENRLYKKGEPVCFAEGAAGSSRVIEGRLEGLGPGGELLIVPKGETMPQAFITGELRVYSK